VSPSKVTPSNGSHGSAALERLAASAAAAGPGAVEAAGAEAVSALGAAPSLLLAFTSGPFDSTAAAAALHGAAPGAVCAGISGNGVFSAAGPLDHGCVAIAFDPAARAGLGVGRPGERDGLRAAGRAAAAEATEALGEALGDGAGEGDPLVLLLLDTRAGDIAEAIAGAYEACGPETPLAGGACGGADPFQLAGGEGLTEAVVAVALRVPGPAGIGNSQSCEVIGPPSIVTRSEGQMILEIDGRAAESVYLERLGIDAGLDDEEFAATAITHPISQPELHGNRRLRHVLGRDGEGGLLCATHIPSSAAVEFTELSRPALIRSGRESVAAALDPLGGRAARAALIFDCSGRRKILGDSQGSEVKTIADSFGGAPPPLAGLYTNGEVARVRGAKGDYNHAVVTVALG
jgi:hypothetical protein